jgi:hypothetical protein
MRSLRRTLLASPAVLAACLAMAPVAAADREVEYVGFSDERVTGTAGVVGFRAVCANTFGSKARACTSQEVLTSSGLRTEIPGGGAWILPVIVGVTPAGGAVDASGVASPTSPMELSCHGWSTDSDTLTGMTMIGDGGFSRGFCQFDRPVVCCK